MGLALLPVAGPGCDRAPEPLVCADVGVGALVITEVRGGPAITDDDGQWVELYNATPAPVDLHGLALTIDSLGGDVHQRVLLRRAQVVPPGGYAVIGKFADDARPAHVDIGWGTTPALPRDGTLALACGEDLDRIAYTALPDPAQIVDHLPLDPPPANHGTYALGLSPPTATGNDPATAWCPDPTETPGPCDQDSNCLKFYKGSPGEPNRGCP